MTALQDWLSFRPADQSVLREMVCRPLRAVFDSSEIDQHVEPKLISPGVERC